MDMNKQTSLPDFKSLFKLGSSLLFVSLLTACGGGSGGTSSAQTDSKTTVNPSPQPSPDLEVKPNPKPSIEYTKINGTLYTFGDIFNQGNAKIEAKCLNNTGFKTSTVTDIYGDWAGEIDKSQLPCKIKAETKNDVYYSYITKADEKLKINPLTSILIIHATKKLPEDWYASADQLSIQDVEQANNAVKNELKLKQYKLDDELNLLNSNYYDLLESLKESVNKSLSFNGYNGLVPLIKEGKISAIPYAPEDYVRLKINYSACSGVAYQGNTKLVTHCTETLMPDFVSRKLVQKNKSICEIQKQGEDLSIKSDQYEYKVKLNGQALDKITDGYATMNTLLLAEGNQRMEILFQYDLLVGAAAYQVDSAGKMIGVINCN
ncbi:hypothetical protein L289_1540 [Acinetobacter gerneri DSM 14967 = CIP 107464 = MTCC 9824]|uniref:Lipoprotein n=2 Tax=Acinetobacter gerneri TaxID=202952 RepID=N8ZUB0_9GAMM|nr:hypothetical protein F960_00381 [Acinetobacter gerneri DSM 14967 = CIP 107464 = MTCC 9824]EPR84305.1 hypothetical protein L289_1540 [Acinetobacter gerneri DSM 14967 = CIP 107464 = MTCC 9824]